MTDTKDVGSEIVARAKGGRPALLDQRIFIETAEGMKERVVRDIIVERTMTGAFAWVAAASAGISQATFFRWMRRGEQNIADVDAENAKREETGTPERVEPDMYGQFYLDIKKAQAQARLVNERKVMKENPLAWLRYGPGRDRPGEPGWTDSSKVEVTGKDGSPLNPSAGPQRLDLSKYTPEQLDQLERLLAIGTEDEGGSK